MAEGGPLGGTVAGRVSHANQGPVWLPTRSAGLATAALSEAIISGPARWMGVTGSKRLRIAEDFAQQPAAIDAALGHTVRHVEVRH